MAAIRAINKNRPLRIMFQDEARFGRLPVMRSAWAPSGMRPLVVAAIERQFRYVYGAVSPIEGEIDYAVMDSMNTENMSAFLKQVSEAHHDSYILMICDGASSHSAKELKIPENMELLFLPPYSPELNPAEYLWEHIREKACANEYFKILDNVIERVCKEIETLCSFPAKAARMFCWPWIIISI